MILLPVDVIHGPYQSVALNLFIAALATVVVGGGGLVRMALGSGMSTIGMGMGLWPVEGRHLTNDE